MEAAQEFHQQLEAHRGCLSSSQLKKQRKKRARLFKQAAMGDDSELHAFKRTRQAEEPEVSVSTQLPAASGIAQTVADGADSKACVKGSKQQHHQGHQQPFMRPSFRLGPGEFEDPRLKVLDPAWFKGADVLDVGCNEGLVTLALAVGCGCRSVTGVDIDGVLIAKACKNLSRSRTQLTQQYRETAAAAAAGRDAFQAGLPAKAVPLPPPPAAIPEADATCQPAQAVKNMKCASNKYEVITCFSVTKWIHLNWGDDGVMKLFHKFYRCLAPNGILVLEPQPFKSYKNAAHKPGVQEAPFHKLDQLKLRPDAFCDFLTQRVGFELVQQLHAVSDATGSQAVPVKGFDRPILVLRKPSAVGFSGNLLN
eukprot:gene7037-7251_t